LIFPDFHAKLPLESRKSVKNTAFSASIEMLDAFRYGKTNQPYTHSATEKINRPYTHSATEKSTSPTLIPLRKNQSALHAFR
jgi:hypothetical protein